MNTLNIRSDRHFALRVPLALLVLSVVTACPAAQNASEGDVLLGEYEINATRGQDNCQIGEGLQQADFAFRARFSVNFEGTVSYMMVSVPPAYAEQSVVQGSVESGKILVTGQNAMTLTSCACAPLVSERFEFELINPNADVDGGIVDAGNPDAGTSDAGGADGGQADGSQVDAGALDGGETPDGGAVGFREPSLLTKIGGTLNYAVSSAEGCLPRDVDAGTGCTLPCEIAYTLSGTRR